MVARTDCSRKLHGQVERNPELHSALGRWKSLSRLLPSPVVLVYGPSTPNAAPLLPALPLSSADKSLVYYVEINLRLNGARQILRFSSDRQARQARRLPACLPSPAASKSNLSGRSF